MGNIKENLMKYQDLIKLLASLLNCVPNPHTKLVAKVLHSCSDLLAELITKIAFTFHTTA